MTDKELADEQRLIAAARKDTQAFGKLYDQYFEQIFHFILRHTDDEGLTGDLVSQTFLKALQGLGKYEYRGVPFSAWLYRIAHNEVNKYFGALKRKKVFSLEEEQLLEFIQPEEEKAFDDDCIVALTNALKVLPTEAMEVLELRFFEEKNFREISYILNITESGAKMRLYRAIEKLRKKFNVIRTD